MNHSYIIYIPMITNLRKVILQFASGKSGFYSKESALHVPKAPGWLFTPVRPFKPIGLAKYFPFPQFDLQVGLIKFYKSLHLLG
jgi:hypothetical protein